jgi:hypothetical protein
MTTQAADMASLVSLKGAVGVGATAALASKAWKRGDHRVFVAVSLSERDIAASMNMHKVRARCVWALCEIHASFRDQKARRSARGSKRTTCVAS